jgi:uncharacterized protein
MDTTEERESPFHAGELAVQERCGVREQIDRIGRAVIRESMPLQHRQFFSRLPILFAGHADAHGRIWASVLGGTPGFVRAIDARTLRVDGKPAPGDPLESHLRTGTPVGFLGIDLSTRRRNRVNGVVSQTDDAGFTIAVRESFGNCPQYIQARAFRTPVESATLASDAPSVVLGTSLGDDAAAIVRRADTFFLASSSGQDAGGADVSHRGGKPGFVRVRSEGGRSLLVIPDFVGNFLFNTLGNLTVNPRAGLLFLDFDSGDLLQLTGSAEIVWDGDELESFEGAQRLVRVTVEQGLLHRRALPLAWTEPDFARQLDSTGAWPERKG